MSEGSLPPVALPIRVLVKGASMACWISMMNGPRTDFAYPRVIEQSLRRHGHPADVWDASTIAGRATNGLRSWRDEVVHFSPDVVVLHYGMVECIHLFLPRWLEQHVNSLVTVKRPGRSAYRKHVLRPLWRALAQLQCAVDRRIHRQPWVSRHRAVGRDMTELIRRVRQVGSPLVLVPLYTPPNQAWDNWFPGMAHRGRLMNRELERVVADIDSPDVRVFRTPEVLLPITVDGDLRELAPDGVHFNPAAHRAFGEAMAEEILDWAAGQPHLAHPIRTDEGA